MIKLKTADGMPPAIVIKFYVDPSNIKDLETFPKETLIDILTDLIPSEVGYDIKRIKYIPNIINFENETSIDSTLGALEKTEFSQAIEHYYQAKKQLANAYNERSRKNSVRDCASAMESLIKILGNDNDIKNASKILRDSKKWGLDDIVKEGHSIFNNLHRLYPDLRHGTEDSVTSTMSINEAKYWVERISTYILYMVRMQETFQNNYDFISKQDINITYSKIKEPIMVISNDQNEDFEEKELALLGVILSVQETPNSGVFIGDIKKQMKNIGFDDIDINLSIRKLTKKRFIYYETSEEYSYNHTYEIYLYFIGNDAEDWILKNSEKLKIGNENKIAYSTSFDDEDLPF